MFCIVYLDDIVVYSKTKEEYIEHINKVLEAIEKAHLKIKRSKTKFYIQRIEFLRFIILPGRISMDPRKIKAVQD